MLRKSPHRLLVSFTCCALCLTAIPAAAQPGLDSPSGIRFEVGSWLGRLWQVVGEPVVSLFAADETQTAPPPPTPPTSNSGITIDPDGVPRP